MSEGSGQRAAGSLAFPHPAPRTPRPAHLVKRLLLVLVLLAVTIFAIQGGEYGTTDLLTLRDRRARLVRRIDSLEKAVDSLEQYRRAVANDPRIQERIAREEFGMVRGDRELLYRFAEPRDSTR